MLFAPKTNPHPCGYYGDFKRQYQCSPRQIEDYRQRISGPLLDRIDLHVEVPLVDFRELTSNSPVGENSAISTRQMKTHCQIDAEASGYLEHAMEEMNFSAHDRILKVARTLADLAGAVNIRPTERIPAPMPVTMVIPTTSANPRMAPD